MTHFRTISNRPRIGITQRLDLIQGREEHRDGLDTRWAGLLWNLGLVAIPLNNCNPDPVAYLDALGVDGFVLSGGNDLHDVPERNILETAILKRSIRESLPVFGVCRGFQFMNYFQGGKLAKVDGHVAIRHDIQGELADKRQNINVNSYHHWAITSGSLGSDLIPLAYGPDATIEAFRHESRPWLGIMWHPEREEPFDKDDSKLIYSHFGGVFESDYSGRRTGNAPAPPY